MRLSAALAFAALSSLAQGCRCRGEGIGASDAGPAVDPPADAVTTVLDFLAPAASCRLEHQGILLDLGNKPETASLERGDAEPEDREGASWLKLYSTEATFAFDLVRELTVDEGFSASLRARAGAAKRVSVSVDGRAVGTAPLPADGAGVVSLSTTAFALGAGAHELTLRFSGAGSRQARELNAHVDWIRLGPPLSGDRYAAPTRAEAIVTAEIGGVSRRTVSLRAPGAMQCSAWIAKGAALRAAVGVAGGEADVEVRYLRDGQASRVLTTEHLGRAEAAAWRPIRVALPDEGPAAVELVAVRATKGARVSFAEPRIEAPAAPPAPPAPQARAVVLVVLGSLSRRDLAIHGGQARTPALDALAAGGLVFERHRAGSPWAQGEVASMLTGKSTADLAMFGPTSRPSSESASLPRLLRDGGVQCAMFSANPTTSAAFGFDRDWETFASRFPPEDSSAHALFSEALRWVESRKDARFFLALHLRGGHPPWSASPEELAAMPPSGYGGAIEPRHGAEVLGRARVGQVRLTDADRERAWALHRNAVEHHDRELAMFLEQLERQGRAASTLVLVTGDVGTDPSAHAPIVGGEDLSEYTLAVPLVLRPPSGAPHRPSRVTTATTSVDIARTVLAAFALAAPEPFGGVDLFRVASPQLVPRSLVATAGERRSTRWGDLVRLEAPGRSVRLCDLALEPDCVTDVSGGRPISSMLMRDGGARRGGAGAKRAAAWAPDADTQARLRQWGL